MGGKREKFVKRQSNFYQIVLHLAARYAASAAACAALAAFPASALGFRRSFFDLLFYRCLP